MARRLSRAEMLQRKEYREVAVGAALGVLRATGIIGANMTLKQAHSALDDLSRADSSLTASMYWVKWCADDAEMERFARLWREELRERIKLDDRARPK